MMWPVEGAPVRFDVAAAWRRALVYALVCLGIGALTGVLGDALTDPPASQDQLTSAWWWIWTVGCFAVVAVGYWVIWPMGTLTHGRALHLPSVIAFGLLWGIAEGVLFASVWAVADRVVGSDVAAFAVAFVVVSAYLGLWHQFYWDIHVAPEHNILEWNARKVVFVHVPNLLVTLPYLAVTGCTAIFVAVQAFGLVGATRAMHYPAFPGWASVLRGAERTGRPSS